MATTEPAENGSTLAPELDLQPASVANDSDQQTFRNPTTDSVESAQKPNSLESESALPAQPSTATTTATTVLPPEKRWPGWPGDCVFRLIVPVSKVGSIIGRKGDIIKRMCEETRARIKILEGPIGSPDRIVLISGKEEPEVPLSPAMDATVRVFKRVSGLPENDAEANASGTAFCSSRLLVASTQAINLIGKQGSLIKSIQENTGASVRVLSGDEVPLYAAADERVVEMQGEALKVLKAVEAVVGHLRKFLVDHSVLPLFEKTYNSTSSQERQVETIADKPSLHSITQSAISSEYTPSVRRESLYLEREPQIESHFRYSGISLYGQDPALSTIRSSSGLGRPSGPIVTQIAQTMQIPMSYAEDIIGIGGNNIEHIRRSSGAIITVQESRGLPDEITVEIKGTSTQVQTAQQLIQEYISSHKEPVASSYGSLDTGYRSAYSLGNTSYTSSSLSSQPYSGYGSSGLGGYTSYRL